jgi:hypothetical protein
VEGELKWHFRIPRFNNFLRPLGELESDITSDHYGQPSSPGFGDTLFADAVMINSALDRQTRHAHHLRVYLLLTFDLLMNLSSEGLTDPNSRAKSAVQLHAEGLGFLNRGRYQDAVTVWLREFSLDPKNANTANTFFPLSASVFLHCCYLK